MYLPSQCLGRGNAPIKGTQFKDSTPDKDEMPPNKKLKIANALSSILKDDDYE
jgi:hypothetical protein